jgi:hypothetical protein
MKSRDWWRTMAGRCRSTDSDRVECGDQKNLLYEAIVPVLGESQEREDMF